MEALHYKKNLTHTVFRMLVIEKGEIAVSINKGMMSSVTDQWATPQDFFDKTSLQYGPFDIDVCADATNAKCAVFFDKSVDGLKQKWVGKLYHACKVV